MLFLYLFLMGLLASVFWILRDKIFSLFNICIRLRQNNLDNRKETDNSKEDDLAKRDIYNLTFNYHTYLEKYKESQQSNKGFGFRKRD